MGGHNAIARHQRTAPDLPHIQLSHEPGMTAAVALVFVGTLLCAAALALVAIALAGAAALAMGLRWQHADVTDLTPWQGRSLP